MLLSACVGLSPAHAVIILDSTWSEEGGSPEHPGAGFGANIALAHEPQFNAVIAFSFDGKVWGECSGVWLGNDDKAGYVLTAGHCFPETADATNYFYRSEGGTQFEGAEVFRKPEYVSGDWTGYDVAIVKLDKPVTDGGPQPVLYEGKDEAGKLMTFVGYGSRGIGSAGQKDEYYAPANAHDEKAAGQGIVEAVTDAVEPVPALGGETDAGNTMEIFLAKEDGSVPDPNGGSATPPTRLAALAGSGDSGSAAWMQRADGSWVVIGITSAGSGDAQYGDTSSFSRVSFDKDWILSIFPAAKFEGD